MSTNISLEDVAELLVNKTLAKPQLTQKEAFEFYGKERVSRWIKHSLLKPICQNGKGSKIYYDHLVIIKLSREFHHEFTN